MKEYFAVIKPNCKDEKTVEEFLAFIQQEPLKSFKGFKLEKTVSGECVFVQRMVERNFLEDLSRYPCKWLIGVTLKILSKEFNKQREERS